MPGNPTEACYVLALGGASSAPRVAPHTAAGARRRSMHIHMYVCTAVYMYVRAYGIIYIY